MRLHHVGFWTTIIMSLLSLSWQLDNSTLTSTLKSPVERVFSRRKRWLLFPKGTAFKFTVSLSKRLLAIYPRGFNFNIEAASYYPVPSARSDLLPKRFRKPTTKAPPKIGPTPLNLIGIPGSLIKYRAKPATRPPLVQRIDHNITNFQWVANSQPNKWANYKSAEYLKKYQLNELENKKYNQYLANKWPMHYNEPDDWHRYNRDTEDFNHEDYQYQYYEDLENFSDSPHYYNHRSRRDLFRSFESFSHILGIDMKICILRAMCDTKRFLLPPGYSMIQDIARVILTFPTIDGLKDDYSRITSMDYNTCDSELNHKCPFSLLEWFINPKRVL